MSEDGGVKGSADAAAERLLSAAEQRGMKMLHSTRLLAPRQCALVLRCKSRACNDWRAVRWLGTEKGGRAYFKRIKGQMTIGALAMWCGGEILLVAVAKPRLRSGE